MTVDTNVCVHRWHSIPIIIVLSIDSFQRQLNLLNLSTLLERVSRHWDAIGSWMNVPHSKLKEIKSQHSGDAQRCSRACWELYLKDHPFPTWQLVAYALYRTGFLEELEVVIKKYLKGE